MFPFFSSCPGAVMFFFRLPDNTKILHTGDFRASYEMESEPTFWNHDLDTVYLDTTYLSHNYRFCSQFESINAAMEIVAKYKMDHIGDKFLIVIGSYLIGKEKVWANIAKGFNLKVWAEKQRRQALEAIGDPDMLRVLVDDPKQADIHVLGMGRVFYDVSWKSRHYWFKHQSSFSRSF
jgi:DNA cross-link repair 1A protein